MGDSYHGIKTLGYITGRMDAGLKIGRLLTQLAEVYRMRTAARTAMLAGLTLALAACSGGSSGSGGGSSDPMVQRAQVALDARDMCDHVNTTYGNLDAPGYAKAGLLKLVGDHEYAPTPLLIKIGKKTDTVVYTVCPVKVVADSVKNSTSKTSDDTDVVLNSHLEFAPWAKDPAFQRALMPTYMTVNGYTEALKMAPTVDVEESYQAGHGWGCTVEGDMSPAPCGTASP